MTLDIHSGGSSSVLYGLGRPMSAGSGPLLGTTLIPENTNDAAAKTAVWWSWTSNPGTPDQYYRRVMSASTAGRWGVMWEFPRGIIVPQSDYLVLATASLNTYYFNAVLEE
jgi:hypothetical protein